MRVIVILGMHRSGTSAVARTCNLLGADLGGHLMPARDDNPTGFWELQKIGDIHDELLVSLGLSWQATGELPARWWKREDVTAFKERLIEVVQGEFGDARLACLKDPRLCRLVPLWHEIFEQLGWSAHYLLVVRDPLDVARSMERRNDFPHAQSHLLWLRHMLEAEKSTRDGARAFIGYDQLLEDWRAAMESAWARLGLGLLDVDTETARSIADFLQAHLRHHATALEAPEDDEPLALVKGVYRECIAATRQDTPAIQRALSAVGHTFRETASLFEPIVGVERGGRAALEAEKRSLLAQNSELQAKASTATSKLDALEKSSALTIAELRARLESSGTEISKLKAQLESNAEEVERLKEGLVDARQMTALLMSSTSWRVTAPLRGAKIGVQRAGDALRTGLGRYLRWLFSKLPIEDHKKLKLRALIVNRMGPLVRALPVNKRVSLDSASYERWVDAYDTLSDADRAAIKRHIGELEEQPLISVVMPVFNTPEPFLRASIQSVVEQLYPCWELCIADDRSTEPHVAAVIREYQEKDGRIKAVFRQDNGNISACSNSALELASGEFIALLDHDDELPAHALYMIAVAIDQNPDADVIYSDEDKIDEQGRRHLPYFKPDWNPDLFYCQNVFNHLSVYRTSTVKRVRGFRQGFEGSQDYDLALRVIERASAKNIVHLPHVLYHWRNTSSPQSFSQNQLPRAVLAAQRAVREHFERMGIDAQVESAPGVEHYQRVRRPVPDPAPSVSLIIPTRDKVKLLKQSVDGILSKTSYPHLEVIIVDNGSVETDTHEYLREVQSDQRVRVIDYDREFNYSAINNFAISRCNGDLIGLINNDIVVINPQWLSEMVSHAVRPEVGAVGAMLYYPDDTVQHAGVIVGRGGVAGHSHKHFNRGDNGYFGRLKLTQDVSGVTGACLVARREILEECGGLDEDNLGVAFNDVDLCLRIRERGYLIVWTPYAEMYHLESASRGLDTALDKVERFNREIAWMQGRWGSLLLKDPYYNPNLTLENDDFSPAFPPRVGKPWARVARVNSADNTGIKVVEAASET